MTDNFTADPGSGGDTFRADDIAGVKIPAAKISLGADGTDDGFVSASNPLPVQPAANASTTAATLDQAVKTVADAGTPERLAASATLVESVQIQACKGFNTANAGAVFIGSTSGNDANYLRLRPWETLVISAPAGKKIDLNQIYIDVATNGDGVSYLSVN